ncbi:MAG: hypothetical protein JOZ42_06645 [Acetobacteraceae bacterium]|nr:hypothetical protein [Acetobacteraceae bacterium]
MRARKGPRSLLAAIGTSLVVLLAAGCSSSFGGGSPPSRTHVIVMPEGQGAVCSNGAPPPCR